MREWLAAALICVGIIVAGCQAIQPEARCTFTPANNGQVKLSCGDGDEMLLTSTPPSTENTSSSKPGRDGPTLEGLTGRLELVKEELGRLREGSKIAASIAKLIVHGSCEEAVKRFEADGSAVIGVAEQFMLKELLGRCREDLSMDAYRRGITHYEKLDYERAKASLERSLSFKKEGPYTPLIHHHLGMSLFELNNCEEARKHLAIASKGPLPRRFDIEAGYYSARAAEECGRFAEAHERYKMFVEARSFNPFSQDAVRRQARLEREHPIPVTDPPPK